MADQTNRRRKPDPLRCLNGKVCGFCDGSLRSAARGHCGGIHQETRKACWWTTTLRDYGPQAALSMSRTNKEDGPKHVR